MALLLNHLASFLSRDEMYHRGNADFTNPSHGVMAVSLWTLAASVSVLTSRYLLVEINYHFPLHLLLINLFVVSAFLVSHRFASALRVRLQNPRWLHATVEYTGESKPDGKWYHGLPTALCLAAALPLSMQAILHWTNLSTLVLMPAFAYLFSDMWSLFTLRHRSVWIKLLEVCLHALCCAVMLYDEYRLTARGIICTLLAVLFTGLAMGFGQTFRPSLIDVCTGRQPSPSLLTTTTISFFATLVCCAQKEDTLKAAEHLLDVDPMLLGLNVASTLAALLLGHSFIVPISIRDHFSPEASKERVLMAQVSATFGFAAMVGFASSYLPMRSYATVFQAGAFCLAVVCILNGPQQTEDTSSSWFRSTLFDLERLRPTPVSLDSVPLDDDDNASTQGLLESEGVIDQLDDEPWTTRLGTPSVVSIAAYSVIILTWIGFLACNFAEKTVADISTSPPKLDLAYTPSHGFDVVISMYKEPIVSIQNIMAELSAIPAIADQSPRLFLYTKDEDMDPADLASLRNATDAFDVIKLANTGREGATYLSHMLRRWDALATHTLFVQADVHNPREFFDRVRAYYLPHATGMLNLGFSGQVCNTASCGDRWNWYEDQALLTDICKRVDGESCEKILLSYKGQFVVSAKRIRAVERGLYEDLSVAMTDAGSWAHREPYLKGRENSVNAPRFGYTVERLWGVVMQCSNEEVAWRCPTLLSRTRRGGGPTDCQCVDPAEAFGGPEDNSTIVD